LEIDTFWCLFFLVKQHILYKTTSFHSLFIEKKKAKWCCFDGIVHHLLPLVAQRQGKKVFLPLFCNAYLSLSLSLSLSVYLYLYLPFICQKTPTQPTPPHGLPPWWKGQRRQTLWVALGQLHRDHPSHSTPSPWLDRGRIALSLLAPYKYSLTRGWSGGREDKKGNERK